MEANGRYVYNTLRYHRLLMNYKFKDVARLLNLERQHQVGLWENGTQLPSTINLLKLCIIYRSFPHELYPDLYQEISIEIAEQEEYLSNLLS